MAVAPMLPTGGGLMREDEPTLPAGDTAFQQALEQEQQQALRAHEEYARQLQMMQEQATLKQADLDLSQRLLQTIDPSVDKSAKDWLFNELSQRVGVDPRGETSKQVKKALLGLSPETSEQLRRVFTAQATQAQPGQVNELIKGILTGQVGASALLGMVQQASMQQGQYQAAQSPTTFGSNVATRAQPAVAQVTGQAGTPAMPGGPGGDRLADPNQPIPPRPLQPGAGSSPDYGKGSPAEPSPADIEEKGKTTRYPKDTEQSFMKREGSSIYRQETGIDPGHRMRNEDVIASGRNPSTNDEKDALEVRERRRVTVDTIKNKAKLADLLEQDPSAWTGAGGFAKRVDDAVGTLQGFKTYMQGGMKPEDAQRENDAANTPGAAKARNEAVNRIVAGIPQNQRTAENRAKIEALVVGLGYQEARALGGAGPLSGPDYENAYKTLGANAGNPKTFAGVLRQGAEKNWNELTEFGKSKLGYDKYEPSLQGMSEEDLRLLSKSKATPQGMLNAIEKEVDIQEGKRSRYEKPTRGVNTPEEEEKGIQKEQAEKGQKEKLAREEAVRKGKTEESAEQRAARQEKELSEERRQQGERSERAYSEQKRHHGETEAKAERALEETKRHHRETEQMARDRERRQEEKERRKEIQNLFQNLGTAIARAHGGSIHFPQVQLGGDQDASAFVWKPPSAGKPPPISKGGRRRRED